MGVLGRRIFAVVIAVASWISWEGLFCPGVGRLSGWVCCFLGQMKEVCLVSPPCPEWALIGPVGKDKEAGGRQKFDGSS